MQVEGPSGLGAGTRFALAAKGLHTDYGTDYIEIDIDVAGMHTLSNEINGLVDPAVNAMRQTVSGRIDLGNKVNQPLAGETHDMQHRTEHLTLQLGYTINLDQGWRNESAIHANRWERQLEHCMACCAHFFDMIEQDR